MSPAASALLHAALCRRHPEPREHLAVLDWLAAGAGGNGHALQLVEQVGGGSVAVAALPDFHVIPDVAVLSRRSSNGHVYADDALRQAVPLIEGSFVYVGKEGEDRRPLGLLVRARWDRPSGRVRADLLVEATHPMAGFVRRLYDSLAGGWGLSIDGEGTRFFDLTEQEAPQVRLVTAVHQVAFVPRPGCATSCAD